ncbi:hypothetical protein [Frankia sp. R82]|nr:hypothetical protein [Frankia sp. R82]
MARGAVAAVGPLDEVRGGSPLEETFVRPAGVEAGPGQGPSWLPS